MAPIAFPDPMSQTGVSIRTPQSPSSRKSCTQLVPEHGDRRQFSMWQPLQHPTPRSLMPLMAVQRLLPHWLHRCRRLLPHQLTPVGRRQPHRLRAPAPSAAPRRRNTRPPPATRTRAAARSSGPCPQWSWGHKVRQHTRTYGYVGNGRSKAGKPWRKRQPHTAYRYLLHQEFACRMQYAARRQPLTTHPLTNMLPYSWVHMTASAIMPRGYT